MKAFKIVLILFLAFCLVFSTLSCGERASDDSEQTESADGSAESDDTDQSQLPLTLVKDGKSDYLIVYPEGASSKTISAATTLRNAIENYTGAKLNYKDDFLGHSDTEDPCEILIGATNRAESQAVLQTLASGEFAITVSGTKLVICAREESAVVKAVDYFTRNILKKAEGLSAGCQNGTFVFSSEQTYYRKNDYPIQSLTLNGTPLSQCKIVVPSEAGVELAVANLLARHFRLYTGLYVPVVNESDYKGETAIMLGKIGTAAPQANVGEYLIKATDRGLEVVSDSPYGYAEAYFALVQEVFAQNQRLIALEKGYLKKGADQQPASVEKVGQLRILSHNIWGTLNDYERSYLDNRNYIAKDLYQLYQPDIICLQEATSQYRTKDKVLFSWLKTEYVELKMNTNDPIFYNEDRVELLESGHRKINSTDTGSSWAVFRCKEGDQLFAVINVHFPSNWGSYDDLDYANQRRVLDAQTSVTVLNTIREKYPDISVFHTGDYNCNVEGEPFSVLRAAGLQNVRNLCSDVPAWGSTHTKPTYIDDDDIFEMNTAMNGQIIHAIDHFTYKGDDVTIQRYSVLSDLLANSCSDHSVHFVDFSFTN